MKKPYKMSFAFLWLGCKKLGSNSIAKIIELTGTSSRSQSLLQTMKPLCASSSNCSCAISFLVDQNSDSRCAAGHTFLWSWCKTTVSSAKTSTVEARTNVSKNVKLKVFVIVYVNN